VIASVRASQTLWRGSDTNGYIHIVWSFHIFAPIFEVGFILLICSDDNAGAIILN